MKVGALCLCVCFYECMVRQHYKKSDSDCRKHVGSVPGERKLLSAGCGKTNVNFRGYLYKIILYKSFRLKIINTILIYNGMFILLSFRLGLSYK